MKLNLISLRGAVLCISVILLFGTSPLRTTLAVSNTVPKELEITIYGDGVTRVNYIVEVDPTQVIVYVKLLGSMYETLIVFDQNGFPLDYFKNETGIMVDSLGATALEISYLTSSLTSKEGPIWNFITELPITCSVILPYSTTIIYLDPIPLEISTVNEKTLLIISSGQTNISYLVGIIDSETLAFKAINETETIINEAKAQGIILHEAETLLQNAKNLYNINNFPEAKRLADEAQEKVFEIIKEAEEAEIGIKTAIEAIETARNSGNIVGLEEATEFLIQAEQAFNAGEYLNALSFAQQAFEASILAEKEPKVPSYLLLLGFLVILAIAVITFYQTKKLSREPTIEHKPVDLEYLFGVHDYLREDDRKVICFIAEKGGEAFAQEIRERFDIPRTSAWRLIRRLKRNEIVDERKVGGQTLVKIKDVYREGVN
jgi:uncharacterized membrane protein